MHVLAATVGVSALVLSSALLFGLVKYLGAAYLIYLGIKTMLSREEMLPLTLPSPRSLAQVYRQGVVVNALNPKTALFFWPSCRNLSGQSAARWLGKRWCWACSFWSSL